MKGIRPLWRIPGIVARERRHPRGRQRVPEPMVMNDPESVAHFHAGGVTNPGMQGVYDFGARSLAALLPPSGRLLDLGVGSGRALSAVLRRRPDVTVTAVDLAENMLNTAAELFVSEGIDHRVELIHADITALPDALATDQWDAVSCMWTLHQLPDFTALRAALHQIAALRRRSGAAVWISDFQRLRSPSTGDAMLRCVDPNSPSVLRNDAMASEAASFTTSELAAELTSVGLNDVHCGVARPLPYLHAFWLPGVHHGSGNAKGIHDRNLGFAARREAAFLRWGFTAKPFSPGL